MNPIKFLITLVFVLTTLSCNGQTNPTTKKAEKTGKIEVYYFHFTARCVTCKTLEAEAKKDVETLYPKLFKKGMISFQSVNLDEKTGEALADKLKVNGQTLLIVKGKKQVNITNEGFLYARSNPKKFKEIIKEKIDELKK